MDELIFATNNQNKAEEIRTILGKSVTIKTLKEAGINIDIPEPHDTLEKNATEKSSFIYHLTKKDCFSEDTGLEVKVLNGDPGVRSARYNEDKSFNNNIDKLLYNLKNTHDRQAQFRTVISLILRGKEYKFEGICKGIIIAKQRGEGGFGYDSVFMPEGSTKTFAEMEISEKNTFSHRRKAVEKLLGFLNKE